MEGTVIRIHQDVRDRLYAIKKEQGISYNAVIRQLFRDIDYIELFRGFIKSYQSKNTYCHEDDLLKVRKVLDSLIQKETKPYQPPTSEPDTHLQDAIEILTKSTNGFDDTIDLFLKEHSDD